jgi:hypothetical protein
MAMRIMDASNINRIVGSQTSPPRAGKTLDQCVAA